jgi:chorismate synthase
MSGSFGNRLKISVFGESHGRGIGVVVDGLPAGEEIDEQRLCAFLARRAGGKSALTTPARGAGRARLPLRPASRQNDRGSFVRDH